MSYLLKIIHLPDSGQVHLACETPDGNHTAPPAVFKNPLAQSDYQEIGWYFQEYFYSPLGNARARAEAVETGLRNLGRLLFETVFRSNPEAAKIYENAVAAGLSQFQLAIISSQPEFLTIPWELLNEPEAGYLASQLTGIDRRTTISSLSTFNSNLTTEQLNLLMVSPAPEFDGHHQSDTLAPETLHSLDSLNVQVELDYLRPPTYAALAQRLSQRQGYYHLLHLDGIITDGPGVLVFEGPQGQAEPVSAEKLAELLLAAQIPVAIITSGRSSDAGQMYLEWSATAAQLAQQGVPAVVAVPHPLPPEAREQFAQRLYSTLSEGADLPAALAQARKGLMDNPLRATLAGKLVSWDWIIPTLYQSWEYKPPVIDPERQLSGAFLPPGEQLPQAQPGLEIPRGGPLGLIGRQYEMRHLERLLQQSQVVLMQGSAGVGKTELSLGLANWLQKSGSRPGGVFYSTFEVGAGIERIVHEIGTAVAGLDFADMNQEQRRRWVTEYLQEQPSLLVWDGLETAAGFPPGASGLLDAAELAELADFLAEATSGGQTWALLTSRRPAEPWLTVPCTHYQLNGLEQKDATELSVKVMESVSVEPGRIPPEYPELLEVVQRHPLAIQLLLPLLKQVPAPALSAELPRAIEQLPPTAQEEGRDAFLTALMEYAFSHMSHRNRTHLPFLALFQRRVMLDIVTHITQERVYRTVFSEELGWGACRTLLRSAREAGFLEPVTPSVFQIHPAFPWFYGRKLSRQISASGLRQLEQEFVRVYADTADYFMEQLYENQDAGATAVLAEEGNLTQALALALEAQQWESAQIVVQPIAQVYRMQKRFPELHRLRHQLLQEVGETAAAAEGKGATELWLYLVGTEANEATELMELQRAEELNQTLLEYLSQQPEAATDPRIAAIYHQFGVIALHRRRLDEAEGWFRRSLEIIEKGDDPDAVADDYYSLGQVKLQQRYYGEAKEWSRKALDIHHRSDNVEEMVKDYRSLGLAAQYRFEYDEAESWYNRARELLEEHRDEENAILVYHELGTLCHARYQYDEAESWYRQALTLSDRLGKHRQMAIEFHHLGLLSQTRGLFYDDAQEWYELALDKWQELGDQRSQGDECRQMGVLFHEQKQYDQAQHWYNRAREIFEDIQDLQRTARTYGQLGMVAEEQGNNTNALEWVARTYLLVVEYDLPVLTQVKAHLARLRDKLGEAEFVQWWRGYTGGDPPTDLEVDTSTIL